MWPADDQVDWTPAQDEAKLVHAIAKRTWFGFKTPFSTKELFILFGVASISVMITMVWVDIEGRREQVFRWRVFEYENVLRAEQAAIEAQERAWRNCMARVRDHQKCEHLRRVKSQ